ncbi:MAG: hypothetical protein A2V50_05065 [Bacteroidetes bacterium RBG_19FT_COMBO_42_10]|nr:MAG: hypothetical protein A2V50_05065 [Bacteroidetes bacterium RBG_19FT_COMBO_42_10]
MIKHKRIPLGDAIVMLSGYAKTRIVDQIKSVAFIIIYLIVFQTLILGVPLANAIATAGGIALVVFGLAFFLEGLVLGLMPLGERVGVKLPTRVGILIIAIFGLILGFGATLAEPAISALRTAGSTVTAWDSPLLYMLLEHYTESLVLSVGIGVGIAVALGMFRFYFNLAIKPFILIIIPILLVLSVFYSFNSNLNKIIGLAWDCGAVTTGAVTVPLVLALGIGVSRAASKGKSTSSGFGIILLASAFPILAVLLLGFILNSRAPKSTTETAFFSPAGRENALVLFETEEKLLQHAFTHGTEEGRRAFYSNDETYRNTILSLENNENIRQSILGFTSLQKWLISNASDSERDILSGVELSEEKIVSTPFAETIKQESIGGIRAVIPLSLLLIIVLLGFLREKLRYKDEVALGIIFTLIGMTLLTSGIKLGLASLGGEVGAQLPRAFASEEKYIDRIVITNFDKNLLYNTISPDGTQKTYFNYSEENKIRPIEFRQENFDESSGKYEYIITQAPLFGSKLSVLGIILVLIFAFGMGYGATLAEPALKALGMTVEGMTVGTIKQTQIVQVVSVGVGIGILLGISRILFDLPLIWLIVPSYILLIPLTIISDDEFSAIAWDSGGVTTGPVTVPLVLAMGLSIGGELNISDGFGVLALASAFPIVTVLLYGLYAQAKQRRSLTTQNTEENE